ncbi:ricin-type beta-trefoil lectin protein [Streptomyces sp. TLI_55]|uniref:RICIN domain-containing protein n=1 Tax=Streptomyces sp. TLI_55 TaxID=1938861 RepID=UPI000BD31997|nr:RICIN domain-containing protein [Streptomyces sp. TLI_55]SNX88337.1 ricin-type beta-trefoil lectin protein [Streptomyces sp. TLI_55]
MNPPHTPRPEGELPKRVPGSAKSVSSAGSASDPSPEGAAADRRGGSLPRLTQLSSLGSRGTAGRADASREPAPLSSAAHTPLPPTVSPDTADKPRREGLRGALGVVGVVGLLSVIGVLVTLGVVNGSDDDQRADDSVRVTSDRDTDVLDALGGASVTPASVSADASGKKPGASKTSASASPSGSGSGKKSAAPEADSTDQAATDGRPKATTEAAVPGVNIFSHDSNRCIDIVGGQAVQGAKLMIWDCSGAASQRWTFTGGTMRALGMCVQLAGGSTDDGTDLEIGTCNGSAAQRFVLNSSHDLVNVPADKCADVRDHQQGNGSRLQLWSCSGQDNQKWSTQ